MQVVNESHIYTDPVSEAFCPNCSEPLGVEGLPAFTNVECPKCSQVFQVPAHFGPFLLIELLGAGGMGGVYKARDEGLKREVAIKVMLQSLGDDIDFVETFQREAQAAAKLNNPHIAQIYSFGQQYGQPYIVMELVSHGSLEEMMKERGGVDPATGIFIGEQIAEGLREAAEAGLVHGDVKPENILFDEEGNAKLVDFGLVALSSGNANEVWGTPFYIAPEKVRRQKSDYRSDIYSLGATLYHAIANKPPFDGVDATAVVKARFEGPAAPLAEVSGKEVPPEVEALIQRMLEVDPSKRYPTYGSLMGDMKRFLSKAGPISLKKSSHRIKIKGKNAVKFDRHSNKNVTGRIAEDGGEEDVDEEEESVQAEGCRKMAVIGALILVGLAVLGGAVFGMIKINKKKAENAKIVASQRNQEKALANGRKAIDIAKRNAAKIKAKTPDGIRYADEAAKMAITVLGEGVRDRMVPPEPRYIMPEVEKSEPEPEAQPAAAATNAVAAAKGTNVVAEAEAEAEPSTELEESVDFTDKGASAADHPVVKTIRQMYMDAYAVNLAGKVADHMVAELEASYKKMEQLKEVPFSEKEMIEISNEMGTQVSGMRLIPEIKVMGNLLKNLKTTLATVKSDLESEVARKRIEKEEQERLARKAAEDAKKKAAMEAHKEKVLNEKARIAVAEGECIEPIKNLRFREALRLLNAVNDELETDEGQLALMLAKERVNRIEEFHKYLTKKATGYRFAKGGVITASDEQRLTVGKTRMFWKDFYRERFAEAASLIAANVSEKVGKEMRIREYARLKTNTALFLKVFYADIPKAQAYAAKLATEAAENFSADADTIKRLLPQFFKEKP